MKKSLVMVLLALAVGLTACGGSDNGGINAGTETADSAKQEVDDGEQGDEKIGADENESEENGMNLSIYPSSNIADFEASGLVQETYDQLYAKVEPLIVETYQQDDGTTIYYDANGNDILILFYEDGEINLARFCEFYENGNRKSEIYTDGIGDELGRQITKWDENGQRVLDANQASRGGVDFMLCSVHDYQANGNLAQVNDYADGVLDDITTYNENGDELYYVCYENGAEEYRNNWIYDEFGKLIKDETFYAGVMESWTEYEYSANGHLARQNEFQRYYGEAPYVYYVIEETYESGIIKKSMKYQLDEGKYMDAGETATEDMYELMGEYEYYENECCKTEINYENEYLQSGKVADKVIIEYDEYGNCTSYTYYDKDGNVIPE